MDTRDDSNPYASPATESRPVPHQPVPIAEQQIRVVIRVFRWIGWFAFGLWFVPAVGGVGMFLHSLMATSEEATSLLLVVSVVNCSIVGVGTGYIWVASRMARYQPNARWKAQVLSSLMLLGFPLFTIVGIGCVRRIRRYYQAYCDERFRESRGAPALELSTTSVAPTSDGCRFTACLPPRRGFPE